MTAPELLFLLTAAVGLSVVLDRLRWARRRPLAARLAPYGSGPAAAVATESSPAAVLMPLIDQTLDRVTRIMGIHDDLATRLARADMEVEPAAFRVRQVLHAVVASAGGAGVALLLRPGSLVSVLAVAGLPLLWVLLDEQQVSNRIRHRSHVLRLELPVVAEQLGILIDAGASMPSALARVAQRGRGAASRDLQRVVLQIRSGSGESRALTEWADRTGVAAVHRLVSVLSLHREAADLGRLISAEARAIRADSHRALIEQIERRGQLVWIPVTVATLVPGLLLLAVPFVSALSQVTGA